MYQTPCTQLIFLAACFLCLVQLSTFVEILALNTTDWRECESQVVSQLYSHLLKIRAIHHDNTDNM